MLVILTLVTELKIGEHFGSRLKWWTWDSRVAGPWRDLISRVSLASAKYLIYTAPTQFVYYHQVAEKNLYLALKKIDF